MALLNNAPTWSDMYMVGDAAQYQSPHPSVLDFTRIRNSGGTIMNTFGGYRYWGATTSMGEESGDEELDPENPFLIRSNGAASGWTNQVKLDTYGNSPFEPGAHQAPDPVLVYDKVNNVIRAFWIRETVGSGMDYMATRTINSSLGLGTISNVWTKTTQGSFFSPAMVYDDSNRLHMWARNNPLGGLIPGAPDDFGQLMYSYSDNNGATWTAIQACTPDIAFEYGANRYVWHVSATRLLDTDEVFLTACCNNGAWDAVGQEMFACVFKTTLSSPTTLTALSDTPLVDVGPTNAWDDRFIYQTVAVPYLVGGDLHMDSWYAAASRVNQTGHNTNVAVTGYTSGLVYANYYGTTATEVGNTLELAGWEGSTTYYKLDGETGFTEYTQPLDLYVSSTFTFYSEDANFTETEQLYAPGYVTAWADYSTPIPIQDGTLEWYAYDDSGNYESVQSADYVIFTGLTIKRAGTEDILLIYRASDSGQVYIRRAIDEV